MSDYCLPTGGHPPLDSPRDRDIPSPISKTMTNHSTLREIFHELIQDPPKVKPQRSVKITIRLTPEEAIRLDAICKGISYSVYIRSGLFGYPRPRPRREVPTINRELYIELKRQGNNINQQARAINQAMQKDIAPPISSVYLEQLQVNQRLLQSLVKLLAEQPDYSEDDIEEQP